MRWPWVSAAAAERKLMEAERRDAERIWDLGERVRVLEGEVGDWRGQAQALLTQNESLLALVGTLSQARAIPEWMQPGPVSADHAFVTEDEEITEQRQAVSERIMQELAARDLPVGLEEHSEWA